VQKAMIVHYSQGQEAEDVLHHLNSYLKNGWRVVSVSPMGAGGGCETHRIYWASFVVLEIEQTHGEF